MRKGGTCVLKYREKKSPFPSQIKMGNQITSVAPAQILPLESYFTELADYGKPVSLGSTRFLKVARTTHSDGTELVVKVFAKHDPSPNLSHYEKRLFEIKLKLQAVANALPFQAFWETEKAAYLVRQHVHFNLYDRISTRPFLSNMEKKWIIFQLLKVLEEAHAKKVCHGDIKTENVLLTSWDWVLLSDFASFKPTLLPTDNPADFSFFFDTSRRRSCYLAPERFTPSLQELSSTSAVVAASNTTLTSSSYLSGPIAAQQGKLSGGSSAIHGRPRQPTLAMDIFSVGCVVAELFMDGRALFDLSQLLEYCSDDRAVDSTLKRVSDKYIRRLVRHMIQVNPSERFTAKEYLTLYRGMVFPEYFEAFLHDYFRHFCISSQLTPDQCIQKLYSDIEAILANIILNEHAQDRALGYGDALVIVLSAITSHLRVAQFVASKLQALEMMKRISHHVRDDCILERILPYLVILVRDKWSSVRAEAVRTLSHCLSLVKLLPQSDFNLFPEYILPSLNYVPHDSDVMVRIAFAECVAELAETAHRFLELAQLQTNQETDDLSMLQYQVQGSYDSELMQLQESFQGNIVHLLSDTNSSVKKAFLKHSAGKLCVFFGPHRAKEVILSHMITFLNDKSDWELHAAFFECIVSVANLLRHHSLPILEPLLQQGLSDREEAVIGKTVEAITTLCRDRLFDHHTLLENVSSLAPFLVHPNVWLRYGTVGFLLAATDQMDAIDAECYILPRVSPFLLHPVIQLSDRSVFLSALRPPVPRGVLDYILKQANIREVFECLTDRQVSRNLAQPGAPPSYSSIEGHLVLPFRKLQTLGLNEEHENSLMALKEHILKQHDSKQQFSESADGHHSMTRAVTDIASLSGTVTPRHMSLYYNNPSQDALNSSSSSSALAAAAKRRTGSKAATASMTLEKKSHANEEWDRMFGDSAAGKSKSSTLADPGRSRRPHPSKATGSTSEKGGASKDERKQPHRTLLAAEGGGAMSRSTEDAGVAEEGEEEGEGDRVLAAPRRHKRSHSEGSAAVNKISADSTSSSNERRLESPVIVQSGKVEYTSCRQDLRELLSYKQRQFVDDMRLMDNTLAANACYQSPPGWTPKGQLIAHINEHKDAINRVVVLPDSSCFVTFSDDGTTKLWDVAKLEGRSIVNKAKVTYNQQVGEIKAGVFCQSYRSIAATSTNGTIHVFNIEGKKAAAGGRRQLILEAAVDEEHCGTVVELANFTAGGQDVLCYATSRGKLCGLDLRSNSTAWTLTNNEKFGVTLSMAVDPFENWVALGTSLGYHVIWDMRFQLPIRHWQHSGHVKPYVHHTYQLRAHPTQPSSLISAVSGNNEVSVWDMETASRRQMLWASPAPPFSEMADNSLQHHSVRGLTTCIVDNCPVVLTGGTDRTIRLWNLSDPGQCSCVVRPKQQSNKIISDYKSKIIEGVDVFQELVSVSGAVSSPSVPASPVQEALHPESTHAHSHVDFITDLGIVPYKNQQFLVSTSRDGVLKLWK